MYFSVPLWKIMGFPSVLLDLSINHVVVFIAETPRPQRIAEIIVNTSANLREPCVSALRIKKKENTTLILGPGTREPVEKRRHPAYRLSSSGRAGKSPRHQGV